MSHSEKVTEASLEAVELTEEELREIYDLDALVQRDGPEYLGTYEDVGPDNSECNILSIGFNTGEPLTEEERLQTSHFYGFSNSPEAVTAAEPVASGSGAQNQSETAPVEDDVDWDRKLGQISMEANKDGSTAPQEKIKDEGATETALSEVSPSCSAPMMIPEGVKSASPPQEVGPSLMEVDTDTQGQKPSERQEPQGNNIMIPNKKPGDVPVLPTIDLRRSSRILSIAQTASKENSELEKVVASSSAGMRRQKKVGKKETIPVQRTIARATKKGKRLPAKGQAAPEKVETNVKTFSMEGFLQGEEEEKEINFNNYVVPTYSGSEKQRLYSDKMFVMDIQDVGKEPNETTIWQILKSRGCLRKFLHYGENCGAETYRASFPPEELPFANFDDDNFQNQYQPIVVHIFRKVTSSSSYSFVFPGQEIEEDDDVLLHYPFEGPLYFVRMTKYLAHIHHYEPLRLDFLCCVALLLLENQEPGSISRLYPMGAAKNIAEKTMIFSWKKLEQLLLGLFVFVPTCGDKDAFKRFLGRHYDLRHTTPTEAVAIPEHASLICSFCPRAAKMEVLFNDKSLRYYPSSLKHERNIWKTNKSEFWCHDCSIMAKRYYRVADYFYNLHATLKAEVSMDPAILQDLPKTSWPNRIFEVTSELDIHRKNTMFLDFQLALAEVLVEAGMNPAINI